MSKVIMVTGGSRSGKSVIAEQKAKEYGKRSVLYLATAIPVDDDMKERIRIHQERRDSEWGTYEGYRDLGEVVKSTEKNTILLDCVTVMITNILCEDEERDFDKISASEVEKLESEVIKELSNLVKAIRDEDKTLIIVSNEVGMSVVPSYRLGRIFSDISGKANLILCILIFCVAAWKLWGYYKHYHGGKKEYEQLRQYVKENADPDEQKTKKEKDKCPVTVDFEALAKVNPDVKAWIYIKGTGINYPIVQAADNTTYLHRTFEGKDSFIGAIFLDAGCEPDFSSENSIVYGHNLKNGQMFGMLKKHYDTEYNPDADYKKHQKVWIITPEEEIEYKVFAARELDVNEDSDVYTIAFASEEDYASYLKNSIEKALYSLKTKPDSEEDILTLSTCTSSSEAGRFIVQATQIQRTAK